MYLIFYIMKKDQFNFIYGWTVEQEIWAQNDILSKLTNLDQSEFDELEDDTEAIGDLIEKTIGFDEYVIKLKKIFRSWCINRSRRRC